MDRAPRVLPPFPEDLSRKAECALAELGVQVETGVMVKKIDKEGIVFAAQNGAGTDHRLDARTVIWAGGVTVPAFARTLARRMNAATDETGRIKVDADLTVPGHSDTFVIGDLAVASDPDSKPLPGVAQVAMQQGTYAAAWWSRDGRMSSRDLRARRRRDRVSAPGSPLRAAPRRLTRRKNGTGIGVVIARSIVQHGGALTYASRPEGGTIATIKLPVCDAQRPFRL